MMLPYILVVVENIYCLCVQIKNETSKYIAKYLNKKKSIFKFANVWYFHALLFNLFCVR